MIERVLAQSAPSPAVGVGVAAHVSLSAVSRAYGTLHALGPIDLALRRGEFFSVVGPSGCGKSTLLDLLAGLSAPSSGSISFEGKPVAGTVPDGIGVVFQEDASFPWLSVWDNIAFGLRRRSTPRPMVRQLVDEAVEFVGLKDFARTRPGQLSGGMRQRVCIARTLVLRPRLILLDEPFGALDQQTRLLMGDELLRLWRATEATVVLITHSIDEAAMLADRIGVMSARPGRFIELVETGWPRERDSRIAGDAAFGRVTTHIWEHLRGESIKALASSDKASR
jgi:NitT/TauT family transport system ATP-binding protein